MIKNKKQIESFTLKQLLWITLFFGLLLWSAIEPKEYMTWFLEVFPALFGFIILAFTYKTFPLTSLTYSLILIHAMILMVGGHYTYAEVPLFDTLAELFDWQRNNYDKVGHFAQGFVPAIIARELLLRKTPLTHGMWLNFIVVSICLALSAIYEILEWVVAILIGQDADAFLGTQGYVWDTQSDMAYAFIGAIVALAVLSKIHNKELTKLPSM
jgi:putative membrane protein